MPVIKLLFIVVKSDEKVFGNPSSLFPIIIIDLNKKREKVNTAQLRLERLER
jgi:hypothetical protein